MKDGQYIGFDKKLPRSISIEVIEKRFHNASARFQATCNWIGHKFTGPERASESLAISALFYLLAADSDTAEKVPEINSQNDSEPMMVEVSANTLDEAMHVIESKFREGYEFVDINLRKVESTLIPGQGWSRIFHFSVRTKEKKT